MARQAPQTGAQASSEFVAVRQVERRIAPRFDCTREFPSAAEGPLASIPGGGALPGRRAADLVEARVDGGQAPVAVSDMAVGSRLLLASDPVPENTENPGAWGI